MSAKTKKLLLLAAGILVVRYIWLSTKRVSVMDENNNVNTKK
jgi:hypothetical protein